jgi:hypothetical protein
MGERFGMTAAAIAAMLLATATQAQDDRRSRQSGTSSQSAARATAPSDNPVKRTWDFTKRFAILGYDHSGACPLDTVTFNKLVVDYEGRVDAFLAGPTDPKKLNLERKNYVRQVLGTERSIAAYLATFDETGKRGPEGFVSPIEQDICRAKAQYYELAAIQAGLKAMARVYPDMTEIAPRLAQVNAAIARIGDDKAIQKLVVGNRSASLAAVRMKPALASNPAWEKGLRDGFVRLVPGETILKLHLYSSSWYVHKHELTAIPEYRQIGAWVATKRADGTCWINGIDLWQNYVGSGFDSGEYKLGQAPQQILCSNV